MRSQIIQIGNSQGIRLPKMLLEQSGITGEVDIDVHPDGLIIRNAQLPRAGWDAAFKSLAENDDDDLPADAPATSFDKKGWQW